MRKTWQNWSSNLSNPLFTSEYSPESIPSSLDIANAIIPLSSTNPLGAHYLTLHTTLLTACTSCGQHVPSDYIGDVGT